MPYTHPDLMAGRERELEELRRLLTRPLPIVGLYGPSGAGKSSLLAGALIPTLRAEGLPVAFDRHPCEAGIAGRLLGDLLVPGEPDIADDNPRGFVDQLLIARKLAGEAPLLVLDQFEDLFHATAPRRARAVLGALMAASVQRLPGLDGPPCRWLLAYRQEFHGDVFLWLGDVLRDAHAEGLAVAEALPHDLSGPARFDSWPLPPLGAPAPGLRHRASEATQVPPEGDKWDVSPEEDEWSAFLAAIEKPLELTTSDGEKRYPWRFAEGSAARLARAFGEARAARRNAPLTPELQVVLAHLLETSWKADDDGVRRVEVPDDPAELIDRALEEHLRRSLDIAFPAGRVSPPDPPRGGRTTKVKLRRTRALLALRELADARGRRDEGRPVAALARAIGHDGSDVLEKLATAQTRLVLLERHGDQQVYVLAHDRLAEAIVRLVDDEGAYAGLGVDAELLGLRRFVALQRELFTSGEVEQSTEVPQDRFSGIERHADALLWDDEGCRWWQACRERRRLDRRRRVVRRGIVAAAFVLLVLLVGSWTDRYFKRQALLETIAEGGPEAAFEALARLTAESDDNVEELSARVREREKPFDVLERGLGGVDEPRRGPALLRVAELLLPLVEEEPEDPVRIASTVWALDFFATPEPALRDQTIVLRDEVLRPLRRKHPPPPEPAAGRPDPDDPHWADIPAGIFWMGAGPDEGRDAPDMQDEYPRHQVTLSAFRMMTHEVTNAEYRRLFPDHEGEDDLPAVRMTWYEAYTYAAWLGGRLPTESEWEYVARAGCGHAYCKRDGSRATLDEVAWWVGNAADLETGEPSVKPVMQLEPNPWRLWDVYGNVREWTATWVGAYPDALERDPPGPTDTSLDFRTIRGGCVSKAKESVIASGRGVAAPDTRSICAGLRVAIAE